MKPIETDRRGKSPKAANRISPFPSSTITTASSRRFINDNISNRPDAFPASHHTSPAQIEALNLLDQLANDPNLNLMMELEPGDIQLVHNHTILYDRTAFEDFPEPERKRHLLRLWLAPSGAHAT